METNEVKSMTREPEYIARVTERIELGTQKLKPGDYAVERSMAGSLLALTLPGQVELIPPYRPSEYTEIVLPMDLNNWTVLIVRPGGFGDLLFLTPIFREIKRRWPLAKVLVSCFPRYSEILVHNPHVDEVIEYPLLFDRWFNADCQLWLERVLETGDPNQHAVDVIADRIGLPVEDKRMEYFYTQEEYDWAMEKYPRHPKRTRRLGVQVHASAANRTYPFPSLRKVLEQLHSRGWEILLFGDEDRVRQLPVDGVQAVTGHSFRQAAAVLSTCDVVLAPDSSLCHVAGALEIPTVALYGPFAAETRVAYPSTVFPLQGKAECAPCAHHDRPGHPWPAGCPALQTGVCAAMEAIRPETIVERVLSEYIKGQMRRGEAA
jgi:ADP-heptose:LPS heptosyltransferase